MPAPLPPPGGGDTVRRMAELTLLRERFEPPRDPPVVVAAKLLPPRLAGDAVPRPRLLRLLDQGADRALTVVAAPPGFGKTTLLAQWRAQPAGRPVAWLSLDERDRDPFRVWAHVAAALAARLPQLRPLTDPSLPLDRLVPRLADAVATGPPAALVLDDYHRLGRGASEGSLRWFAEQTAPALQVAVSTASRPPFRLGLLRARGRLLELGPSDLALTELEALALAGRARAPAADGMEGWPAGVRLALDDPDAGAAAAEWALAELGEEERRFLARASVLDRLDGPLCDEVLDRTGSAAVLRGLALESPFLVAVGRDPEIYRLRRALAPGLHAERRRRDHARTAGLHLRAAGALRRRGETGAALEHALAAGAGRDAAALARRLWREQAGRGDHARLLALVEQVPRHERGARLELARGWLLHVAGRRDEALAALDAAAGHAAGRLAPARRARGGARPRCVLLGRPAPRSSRGEPSQTGPRAGRSGGAAAMRRPLPGSRRPATVRRSSPARPVRCWPGSPRPPDVIRRRSRSPGRRRRPPSIRPSPAWRRQPTARPSQHGATRRARRPCWTRPCACAAPGGTRSSSSTRCSCSRPSPPPATGARARRHSSRRRARSWRSAATRGGSAGGSPARHATRCRAPTARRPSR